MSWRWDQGRLDYFAFDEIVQIAHALVAFEGKPLPKGGSVDMLRAVLNSYSALPFLPNSKSYPVWRNYGRVFECQMLATEINRVVCVTDLCKAVANGSVLCDEYFLHFARNFYFSSPVFDGYNGKGKQVFPVCAIVKLLISNFLHSANPFLSVAEIADRIKGNLVNGTEPLSFYASLTSSGATFVGDELRQVREFCVFVSQVSFLKWDNSRLVLDVSLPEEAKAIAGLLSPVIQTRDANASRELLRMGGGVLKSNVPVVTLPSMTINPIDEDFTEGKKVRVTHLRVERSAKLKEYYFSTAPDPHLCDMCAMDTLIHYPWVDWLVELHHLLPLASPIHFGEKKTSIKDVVGLCPTCHRSTHKYYSRWLKNEGIKDFRDHSEARLVYENAKDQYVP